MQNIHPKLPHLIQILDTNFKETKRSIIRQWGDPGHDVGDSATALEMLHNIATQDHDIPDFIDCLHQAIPSTKAFSKEILHEILNALEQTPDANLRAIHKNQYGIEPWYGF